MLTLGFIVHADEQMSAKELEKFGPDSVIVEVGKPTEMRNLERLASAKYSLYPMFHLSRNTELIPNMIEQAFGLSGPVPVYLTIAQHSGVFRELEKFVEVLLEEHVRPYHILFYIAGIANIFLREDGEGRRAVEFLREMGLDAEPCVTVSDSLESRRLWHDDSFLEFLQDFPDAQFHVHELSPGSWNFREALEWGRPTFIRSITAFLRLKEGQAPKEQPLEGFAAMAVTNRDRVTAYEDVDLRRPIRKLVEGQVVEIVEFLSGRAGNVVLTSEGDYIARSYLTIQAE